MSGVLTIIAAVAALNPPRTRLGLPERDNQRVRLELTLPGLVLGLAVLLAVAAASPRLLEALEISPETFRIAAGFVLVVVAAWFLFVPIPPAEPLPGGRWGIVWPVAYPRVISPETLTLMVTIGASDGVPVVPLASAGALLGALALVPRSPLGTRIMAASGRVLAVMLVLIAIWLALEGVRQV